MNITAQTENTICIELTGADMAQLDITYDELDYSNIETRRVLWTLLDEAKHKLGCSISLTQKMLIEALPNERGGCTLYFTVSDAPNGKNGKKQLIKPAGLVTVCQAEDINILASLAKHLQKMKNIAKSELFSNGTVFRLLITLKPSFCGDINSVLSEFCTVCDKSSANFTREHYKKLASPDAVGVLSTII